MRMTCTLLYNANTMVWPPLTIHHGVASIYPPMVPTKPILHAYKCAATDVHRIVVIISSSEDTKLYT
jgi:hypothetical protein